jgi:hypothetical protein
MWQSRTEVRATALTGVDAATVMSAEGRSMNPKRGVQLVEVGLRIDWDGKDRANRYVSEEESCRRLDPDEGASTTGWQRPTNHPVRGASDDTPWPRP